MFWFSCARDVGLCLYLFGLLVALFEGIGCCVTCWFLPVVEFLYRADAPFPRFLGEVLSVCLSFG